MLRNEGRMSVHLHNALAHLKQDSLGLAALVEEQLHRAIQALGRRDPRLAKEVIERDAAVDRKEVDIEEQCLHVLALHQPVAHDLRFVITILKMNNDLERIADYAVNISERVTELANREGDLAIDFSEMASKTIQMLHNSIQSLITQDVRMAHEVCLGDDVIDKMHRENFQIAERLISERPTEVHFLIQLLSISRCLERVADQATNIAEDVVYLVEGKIIRHTPRRK